MRFQTFLFLFLTLSVIDTIAAGKSRHRSHSSPGSRHSGSHGSNSHGSSGSKGSTQVHHTSTSSGTSRSKTSSGDHTQHQQSTNPNTIFLNAEGGGATRPAGKSDSKSGTVTESKQGTSRYEPSAPTETHSDQGSNTHYGPWSNPHGGTNQPNTQSQTHPPWSNPHGDTNQQNTQSQTHPPWSNPHGGTNQQNTQSQTHPPWSNPHGGTNQQNTQSQTHPPWSNPHGGTNQQNTQSQTHPPWSNPHGGTNQQNTPSQMPSIGFKDHVYPSPIPPVQQPSSIPMGNPYSLHPPENTHGASGPTYYPQQPQTFGQPAMHPFVPGQTMFIMPQDSGRDVGQIAKEALIFSTINAGVNRVINPHTHYVENTPASSPASNAGGSVPEGTIPGNNPSTAHGSSTPASGTTNNGGGATVNDDDVTGSTGTSTTVIHHHHHHHHHDRHQATKSDQTATKSNQTATNQTNSPAGPSIVVNSIHKISDNDIFNITEELFAMSLDISKYIRLDLQIRSTSPNATDEAKKPLFNIDPILMNYPSIYITHTLYDKHGPDFRDKVNRTQEIQEHENLLIDTYLNTNVMAKAMKWLSDRGFIDPDDFERKEVLRRIWFTIFGGSTCGFERIFASEKYDKEFIGVRDWLYFANKESLRRIDYMSYVDQLKLGTTASLLKLNFAMDGIVKQNETIFVGTMPELEMALYTICFYARSNNVCQISLGGTKFSVYTHSFIYYGNLVLDFGFPLF